MLAFGTQVRGFKPGRSRRIFSGEKILSTPSFGGEVKPLVPCRNVRHVKERKRDVEVATFGKILGHFSPIVPPFAAGFARVVSDAGDPLWRKLERSNHWSSKFGVLRAAGNGTLLRILNASWVGQNPTRGCSADWRRSHYKDCLKCWNVPHSRLWIYSFPYLMTYLVIVRNGIFWMVCNYVVWLVSFRYSMKQPAELFYVTLS